MDDHDLLIRIDENVGAIKQHAEQHQAKDDEIHKRLDDRLRVLEATRQSQKGAITAITAVMSAIWAAVVFAFETWRHH
jgi:hypothetical protein